MYRSATGETRSYEGWMAWAINFYANLTHDEMGRDVSIVKHTNVMMPKDWWQRTQRVLKLERVEE